MANVVVRTRCGCCGKTWDTYWRDIMNDNANQCPFCGAEVDRQLWEKFVFPAGGMAYDMNRELQNYATGYNKPRFSINLLQRKEHETEHEKEYDF